MGIDPQFFGGMYVANDTVAFMGGDLQHVQFWKTDGTGANTYKAMDITIRDHYWSMYVTPYKGEFYIRPDSVYVRPSSTVRKVDASASGLVSTFFDSPCASMLCTNSLFNSYFSLETFVFKGILYFFAPSEINGVVGVWLWKSDGTQSGTEPVQVVCNGSCPFG
jgi:ELWxxDGT repeat protein